MIQTNVLDCAKKSSGTYFDGCKIVMKDAAKIFLKSPAAKIDLTDDAFDESARALLIKKNQLVALNDLLTMTEAGAKANIQSLPNKVEIFISNGLYKFSFDFEATVCFVEALHELVKRKWELLILDTEGKLFFDSKNGKLNGFHLNTLVVENETVNDGGSKFAMVTLWGQLSQDGTKGFNTRRGFLVDETLFDCNGIQDVILAAITLTHASFKVSVLNGCDGSTPVLGLAKENFRFVKVSDGSAIVPTGATDNNDGTYTLVSAATATDYIIQLFDTPNNLAVADIEEVQFYKSNALAVTLT